MDLIITHGKCPDGHAAAIIAKRRYPEAEILAMDHGQSVPFGAVKGKEVLVTDFSWPVPEDNVKLWASAKSFHIFDHHRTAEERLRGFEFVTFDMNRSGAGITWDELFGGPRPWWINFVEDRDLWRHALPNSKEVSAYIMSLPMTIEGWDILDQMMAGDAAAQGRGILRHIDRYVKEAVAESQRGFVSIGNGKYLTCEIVNALYMNCSEIGNVLAQKADVGMTWFERKDGMIAFSLRSVGDIDVSEIAKMYLGGGHTHAAGFRLCIQDARELIDTILGRHE